MRAFNSLFLTLTLTPPSPHSHPHSHPTLTLTLTPHSPHQVLPNIPIHAADAEHLPFADKSVNLIFVAQAFHWFANRAALTEFHRVLTQQGRLVLVWNNRDEKVEWIAQIEALLDQYYTPDVPRQQTGRWAEIMKESTDLFCNVTPHVTPNEQVATPAQIADRFLSISVINSLPPAERESVRQRVLSILAEHPLTATKESITVPHTTDVYVYQRSE